ncbi:hypothetical protein VN0805_08860 [Helicobacter pylori]
MKMYNIPTPAMAQVIMVDDPITTTEFVISALRDFFDKSLEEAKALTSSIHQASIVMVRGFVASILMILPGIEQHGLGIRPES